MAYASKAHGTNASSKKLALSVLYDLAATLYMIVGTIDTADKDKKKRIAKNALTPLTDILAQVHNPLKLDERVDEVEKAVNI